MQAIDERIYSRAHQEQDEKTSATAFKIKERENIATATEAFLAQGGKITQVATGISGGPEGATKYNPLPCKKCGHTIRYKHSNKCTQCYSMNNRPRCKTERAEWLTASEAAQYFGFSVDSFYSQQRNKNTKPELKPERKKRSKSTYVYRASSVLECARIYKEMKKKKQAKA